MASEVYLRYLECMKNNIELNAEVLKDLFIQSVKNGETQLAKKILNDIPFENDGELILYKGRFLSQIGDFESFYQFYNEQKVILHKSTVITEGLLPWNWRMAIAKAISNDAKMSNYFFDMHRQEAQISAHEMAHSFQCNGAAYLVSDVHRKIAIEYIYKALMDYFTILTRDENYYSIKDNIRCIVINILLQGVYDFVTGQKDIAYKKFMFCQEWFKKAGIPKTASGISEVTALINRYFPEVVQFVFENNLFIPDDSVIAKAIIEGENIANYYINNTSIYDIGRMREVCIILNKPLTDIKYVFLEGIIMQAKKVFVVEGRNAKINEAMFSFLSSLGLEPIEWEQARAMTGKATPFIGEILDCAFNSAQAIVVLMTPDEETTLCEQLRSERGDDVKRTQPRPNVIYEAGAAMAINPDRTILVSFGQMDVWSDISGKHLLKMDNTSEKRTNLTHRLQTAGCSFSTDGKSRWLHSGDFSL